MTAAEVIADTADRRVEILGETDAMHATRTRLGPRRAGTDPHVHREHDDVFFVLEGELTVRLGAEELAATAGTMVVVPPLVVHAYRNASDADVVFLNVHAPGSGSLRSGFTCSIFCSAQWSRVLTSKITTLTR